MIAQPGIIVKACVLFSGGKDSTYAAYLSKRKDELACLVTLEPSRDDSYMFHFPNTRWTALQAEAMNVPQLIVPTEGVKEVELEDLSKALRTAKEQYEIGIVYTGALASVYQKSRVDRVCAQLELQSSSPLWGIEPREHLLNLVNHGFEVIVTGVAALGLDQTWLGRRLDLDMINQLLNLQSKYHLHAGLEGGEGETFVLNCPLFERKIEIVSAENHWNGVSGFLEITEAKLV